ncbi:MAG: VWA domain-containing protein [Thermoanaerobaculia bacterium]
MRTRCIPERFPSARLVCVAVFAVSLCFGGGEAQAAEKLPRVRGSVEVSLVNVDVAVTGKDGRPLEGLTAADFTVLHGKKPVDITNFREEKLARAATPAPAPDPAPREPEAVLLAAPPARRHVVLFVDHLALPDKREREQVFGSLKSLVRRTVRPGDGVMVVVWRRGVRTAWPYTDDVARIERALDLAAEGTIRLGRESQNDLDQFAATEAFQTWAGEPADTSLSRSLSVEEAFNELKGKASAVMGLVSTMAGLEGKKVLVLASRSFSRRPGVEFSGHRVETGRLLNEVAARANAAGVTIHALYAAAWQADLPNVADSRFQPPSIGGGGRAGASGSDARLEDLAGLETLSGRTGGVLVGTTMESSLFADRVASDLDHWYSIGYPVPAGANASGRVSVRVKRPGAKVRTRREVVDRTPDERMEDRILANLFRSDLSGGLPIGLEVQAARKEEERYVRTALLRVPVRHLVLRPEAGAHHGTVSVHWVVAEPTGEFAGVRREIHEVTLPAEAAAPDSKTELSLELRIESSGPEARISIGVRDEIGGETGFGLIRPAAR